MTLGPFWCLVGLLGLALLVAVVARRAREPYGNVLGAAAMYRRPYFNCVRRCETSDPRHRLSQNAWQCGWACDHLVTDALEGGSQQAHFIEAIPSIVDSCDARCAKVPHPGRALSSPARAQTPSQCRDECVCVQNAALRCAQDCYYAPPGGVVSCFPDCMAVKTVDCYSPEPAALR